MHVVIIGFGYAGSAAYRELSKSKTCELTVVDRRDGFSLHKWATLRASVKGGVYIDRCFLPTNLEDLKGKRAPERFVVGNVSSVSTEKNEIELSDGSTIKYDHLLVCTGARNLFPEPPLSASPIETSDDVRARLETIQRSISGSESIVLVGGGAVSLELAGEIAAEYSRQKKITIVSSSADILETSTPPVSAKFRRVLKAKLGRAGVSFRFNTLVDNPYPEDGPPIVDTKETGVQLHDKTTLSADLLIFAGGARPSTSMFDVRSTDPTQYGRLKVDSTLRALDSECVWGAGDGANVSETKTGIAAKLQGVHAARNVLRAMKKRPPKEYKPYSTQVIIIPVGPDKGQTYVSALPFTLGSRTTRYLKSSDLNVADEWRAITTATPPKPQ